MQVGSHLELDVVHRALQFRALALRLVGTASGQHDDELVARVADADVVRTDGDAQRVGDLAQRQIARVVPERVVDLLEVVEVEEHERHFGLQTVGASQLARQVQEHEAGVRQARQLIGQRLLLRLLEDDRVLDDGRRLLRDTVDQPSMVVAVVVRLGVIDREGADEPVVGDEGTDERRLETVD